MNGHIIDKAVQALKEYEQSEVFVSETDVHTVYVDNSEISNIESKKDTGMMFRMVQDGRTGKASVTLGSEAEVPECIAMAESVLRYSPVSDNLNGFALPSQAKISRPDVFDRGVENVTPDDLRDLAARLIGAVSDFDRGEVKIPRAQIRVAVTRTHTVNSNGVDVQHESTLVYGHFTSMCVRDHPGEGIAFFNGTHLDLDPEAIGKDIASKAFNAATCKEYKGSEKMDMILTPQEGSEMLFSSLGDAVDGENVKYGRSVWKDSVDRPVASDMLSVYDDPSSDAPLSCVFDDEGTATEKRPIIENGVLKGFLRDTFCGESTGNGMRRSSVEPQGAYERTPIIKPLNLTVRPGRYTLDDIISQTDSGIVVEKFASPEADGLTGRFGLNVRCGHIVKNGEIVATVNNALLMGNMYDCLRNVKMIGNDSVQTGVVKLPSVSYGGTELVGNRS